MKSTNGTFFNRDNMSGVKLHIVRLGKAFLDETQNLPVSKGKINKLGSSKLKTCVSKDIIKKLKIQHTEWQKILSNHISDKGLYPEQNKGP